MKVLFKERVKKRKMGNEIRGLRKMKVEHEIRGNREEKLREEHHWKMGRIEKVGRRIKNDDSKNKRI